MLRAEILCVDNSIRADAFWEGSSLDVVGVGEKGGMDVVGADEPCE